MFSLARLTCLSSTKSFFNSTKFRFFDVGTCGFKSKTLEERLGIPARPKKPLTPYFRFMRDIRPTIIANNPKLSANDVVKAMAIKWETVDEKQKKKYQDEYKQDQIDFIKERSSYENTLTDEQKHDVKQLKRDLAANREKIEFRKKVRNLGKPKRAASAFLLYLNDQKANLPRTSQTYREWQTMCANAWNALNDSEKAKYFEISKKNIAKYREELLLWEEKMVRLGHVDLVRNELLVEPTPPKKTISTLKRSKAKE